ncbi:MAG: FtsX-like permease family protein [archaeon]
MIKLSFLNLFRRKSRTMLALLGIIIGVMAIMVMVSVVDGIYDELVSTVSQLQGVTVYMADSGGPRSAPMNTKYINKIESIPGVRNVVPQILDYASSIDGQSLGFSGPTGGSTIVGVDLARNARLRGDVWTVEIESGQALEPGDSGVVIIGSAIAENYDKFVGNNIKVNGKKFKIKGIFSADTSLMENAIVMSIDDARELVSFSADEVSMLTVELVDPSQDSKIATLIDFRFDELDATTSSDLSKQFGDLLGNFRLVVFLIAAVSAVVAGIGIINTMLMSVMERFKEIGALKAVGWTDWNVMQMILYESLFLGVLGGLAGIAFGYAGAFALEEFVGLTTLVSPMLVLQVFLFAVGLGLFGGLYPAYHASKMDPIQALRSE